MVIYVTSLKCLYCNPLRLNCSNLMLFLKCIKRAVQYISNRLFNVLPFEGLLMVAVKNE